MVLVSAEVSPKASILKWDQCCPFPDPANSWSNDLATVTLGLSTSVTNELGGKGRPNLCRDSVLLGTHR